MKDSIVVLAMDWTSVKHEFEVQNYSNLEGLHIEVVSGDHIVTPVYNNGTEGATFDTGAGDRFLHFYDGEVFIDVNDIDKYNKLKYTYDVFEIGVKK